MYFALINLQLKLVIAQRNRTVAGTRTAHIQLPAGIYSDYVFHIVFY